MRVGEKPELTVQKLGFRGRRTTGMKKRVSCMFLGANYDDKGAKGLLKCHPIIAGNEFQKVLKKRCL